MFAETFVESGAMGSLEPPDMRSFGAFDDLVREHHRKLFWFIKGKIGHVTEAEDLTQQTLMEAAIAYDSFRGDSKISTWLYGIAANLIRNHLSRDPHRRFSFENESALAHMHSEDPDPSEQLANAQLIFALDQELQALPDEMHRVLMLVAMDEITYEKAAESLSIPVGTVRSRVSRARRILRKRLQARRHCLD